MTSQVVALKTFRASIHRSSDPVVLCGAGVSMIPPTQLPSGDALRDQCVVGLLSDKISRPYLERIMETPAYRKLLPEIVFQDIAATAEAELDRAMCQILGVAASNAVHCYLATHFTHLFTTNFDLCLENSGARIVGHLHGTIQSPESLQNRIFRLGKTAGAEFEQFRVAAAGKPLLVIGYSFRDRDILDLVHETGPSVIYYLSYDGSVPSTLMQIGVQCMVAKGSAEKLFRLHSAVSVPSVTPMRRMRQPTLAARANALIRLCLSTGHYSLGEEVARKYMPSLHGRARLKALAEVANLYRIMGDYDDCERIAREILAHRSVLRAENADLRSSAHVHLGLCDLDRDRGNFKEIEEHFLHALADITEFGASPGGRLWRTEIEIWKARIYNNLGITYSEWGQYPQSLEYYRRSIKIKRKHHEEVGIANTLNNVTKLYVRSGKYGNAARSLRQVISILRRVPDTYVLRDALDVLPSMLEQTRGIRVDTSTGAIIGTSTSTPPLSSVSRTRVGEIARLLGEIDKIFHELA